MSGRRYQDIARFLAEHTASLELHEAENSLFLGFLLRLAQQSPLPSPFLFASEAGVLALYHGRNLLLSLGSQSGLESIVTALQNENIILPGVVAAAPLAQAFAERWVKSVPCQSEVAMRQQIYRLTAVEPSIKKTGEVRLLSAADIALTIEWIMAFEAEALPLERRPRHEIEKDVQARLAAQNTFLLWEKDRPVAMASLVRPTPNGITINAVFTPPSDRGRGHASYLVAELSRRALAQGKTFCVLYTDLANPTSNKIYQRIGYVPICDSLMFRFVVR